MFLNNVLKIYPVAHPTALNICKSSVLLVCWTEISKISDVFVSFGLQIQTRAEPKEHILVRAVEGGAQDKSRFVTLLKTIVWVLLKRIKHQFCKLSGSWFQGKLEGLTTVAHSCLTAGVTTWFIVVVLETLGSKRECSFITPGSPGQTRVNSY